MPREKIGAFPEDIEKVYDLPDDLSTYDEDALFMIQDLLKNSNDEMQHLAKELLNNSDFTSEALERNKWLALSIAKKYYILVRNGIKVRRPVYVTQETNNQLNALYVSKIFPLFSKLWTEVHSMGFLLEELEELGGIEDPKVLIAKMAVQKARKGNR